MLWGIGKYYWYLLALVLVLLYFCWEAYFLHEVISPSKMFCNFGGGYFLTVFSFDCKWLDSNEFSKREKLFIFWVCQRRCQRIQGQKCRWAACKAPRNQMQPGLPRTLRSVQLLCICLTLCRLAFSTFPFLVKGSIVATTSWALYLVVQMPKERLT